MLTAGAVPLSIEPITGIAGASTRESWWRQVTNPMRALIRESKMHGVWIAIWSVVGWVGTLLMPVMDGHGFILMLLAPRALFAAMAADSVNIVPFVLLGTMRLAVTDASYFIIGRRMPSIVSERRPVERGRFASRLRSWLRQSDRLCRWLSRRPALAGSVLFLRPNGKYLAFAGAYGVSRVVAAVSSVLGTVVFLTALHMGLSVVF